MTVDSKGSILVVDDNPDNRDLLSRRLQRKGYVAVTVGDGEAALQALAGQGFDAVLLDIRMPGMDGLECLRQIRLSYTKVVLPVIMVTAETDSSSVVRAMQLDANDYVTKPLDFPVVLARLEGQLRLKRDMANAQPERILVSSSDALQPGFLLDERYEIRLAVGHGGFAVVYEATQLSTRQRVAIKLLRVDRILGHAQAETELARFEREMQVIGRIQHPNIVRLIDSGHLEVMGVTGPTKGKVDATDETKALLHPKHATARDTEPELVAQLALPFLVMEYLDGEPLSDVFERDGKQGVRWTVDTMLPVLSAVHAAHEEGVVHRDLTPANIFLATDKRGAVSPRVLDFGIAKLTRDDAVDLTVTSSVLGTPRYMSPEQARGEGVVSAASDQYTLAVVLYQALTGRTPFAGPSFFAVLHMVVSGEFPPPRQFEASLPEELDAVIVRAMSLEPQERYPSVHAFGRALLPFASDSVRAHWAEVFSG